MVSGSGRLHGPVAEFWREGFVLESGVFTADEVDALRAGIDAQIQGQALAGPWIAEARGTGFHAVRDLHRFSEAWEMAVARLTAKAAEFYDSTPSLAEVIAICKPPEHGQAFPPHQDGAYYGPDHGRYVIAIVYIDGATPDNGSIRYAPRTHEALIPHKPNPEGGKKSLREMYRVEDMVEPQGKPGDVAWSHLWTVHGSRLNTSPNVRRTARIGFSFA